MSKSILVVDDNDAIRKLTRLLLETQTDLEVCGEAVGRLRACQSLPIRAVHGNCPYTQEFLSHDVSPRTKPVVKEREGRRREISPSPVTPPLLLPSRIIRSAVSITPRYTACEQYGQSIKSISGFAVGGWCLEPGPASAPLHSECDAP